MKKKPLFSTFMCAALIGSLLAPAAVQAETGTTAKAKEQNKISSALYKRFEKEDKVTFNQNEKPGESSASGDSG